MLVEAVEDLDSVLRQQQRAPPLPTAVAHACTRSRALTLAHDLLKLNVTALDCGFRQLMLEAARRTQPFRSAADFAASSVLLGLHRPV